MRKDGATLSIVCRELTLHLTAPNKEHLTALGHLMGYIKQGTNLSIKMRAPKDTHVGALVDSDYASNRNDRKSISGHLVTIGRCLLSWQSKKQTGVSSSILPTVIQACQIHLLSKFISSQLNKPLFCKLIRRFS